MECHCKFLITATAIDIYKNFTAFLSAQSFPNAVPIYHHTNVTYLYSYLLKEKIELVGLDSIIHIYFFLKLW